MLILVFLFCLEANALGETGLITGNSTCSTLGDPSKGVYISKYSDCLDLNRWYHGKSGYIVIIRLTKGKAKKISENYTQNFTAPTAGFDCHVSEELTTVSTKTSSFLAFERTQVRSMQFLPLISSTFLCKMTMGNYLSVIGTIFYDVGLRSTGGASIPAELPPVVKIDRAISMFDLRRLLPKTFFETSFSGEGALAFPLNNGGFLILLHSSYFLRYDDTGSSALEVLQGMFVFPDSRVIQRDAKFGHIKRAISSEILLVLPALSYAESEVEKKPIDPREELCDVFLQHMQRYATLINPRLATSPSRELSIFPDQYDVPEAHKHLYSSPEWTNRAWQNLTSYLRKPDSFQLPVSKASEILTAGQVDRVEDLDDDVYFCLSSPEEGLGSVIGQSLAVNVETSLDCSAEAQVDSTAASPRVVSDNLLIKSDDMGTKTTSTSADLPTELIVSITSAERTVTDASLISNDAQTKHNDFELSHFPTAGYQKTGGNTIDDETVTAKKVLERPELAKTKRRKLRRGHSKGQRCVSKGCIKTVKILKEDHNLKSQKEYQTKESLDHPQLNKLSNIDTRKMQKRKFDQIDPAESEEKITDPGLQRFEKDILRELEACPLKKKMERWDLKPVISECGRILVPHGLDICEQIKVLRDEAQSRKVETGHEEILANVSMNVYPRVKMEPSNAPETRVDEMEATTSKDGGNCPQNNNGMDTPPLTTVKENPPDTLFPGKCATKSASLLNRLKSVLLRKKKKTGFLVLEEMTDTTENPEPCLKKGKVDSLQGMLQSIAAISSVQDPVGIKEVSTMLSVDPHFAFALGLMPKETLDKIDKSEDLDTQQNRCSPTDALTLLADLALSARYGQGSPQPYEALERNPETSLKKCDLTRDVTHSEQESFLHALLRQPAVKPIQAPQCPLPSNVVESSELIGLISKEHAYSYPPSSSLLLDLSGTPYQVFPLSGSTRLLHRHQTINCDGIKSLHPSVNQEDKSEHSDRTSKYLIKHLVHRRKFRLSRTFVNKDGSVQVTKHWKENYDFTLDSKFTTDSKFRTICRALHGPWNISIQDTSKEIRLIFHMWIGLFYSRSTPRFFDFSSNHCSKETDSLGIPSGMLSTPAHSDLKGNSFAPCSNVTDTAHTLTSNALDLSKKDNSIVDHGSEILDLSVRNCSAESITSDPPVNEKESSASGEQEEGGETPNALKTVTALQEASLFQVSEKGNACHNLHVRKLCATGSAMTDHILSEEELIDNDPAVVENIKNVGLADLHDEISQRDGPDSIKKPTQEDSKEDTCHDLQFLNCKSKLFSNGGTLTEENYVSEQVPHASTEKEPSYNESVEENSRSHACLDDKIQTSNQTGSPNLNSGVKDWDTHLDEGEQNVEMTTRKETFCDQSHSTQSDAVTMFETDWELTKETNIKSDQTNKGSEKIHNHIVIPFIGIDTSGEDVVQQQSSGKVEEVQVQKRPPFISETAYPVSAPPTEEWGASHIRNADLSACQLPSFLDSGKIDLQHVSGSESDERCPTPTMDEEPYHYLTSYDSSSSSSSSSSSNISFKTCKTQKCFSKSLELIDNEILVEQKQKSTVNSDPNPHHHLHPDLELRTQKVLQSVNEYHTDRSSQIKTTYMKHYYDQTDKLQAMFKPNIGKDGHQTTSQTNLNHELHSYSQRPVMAVKPSKSDEIQANSLSEKILIEKSVISNVSENKMAEPHIDLNTTLPSKFLKREREILQENTSKHNDEQEASEYSTRSRGVSNLSNTNKSNSDKARYVPLDPNYRSRNISKFKKISSSLPSQSFEFLKTSSKHDGNQSFLVEDVGKTTKKSNETGQKYCSESSTSAVDYREDCIIDDDLVPGPQSTLTCTIFNTDTKKRESLELLKRSKRGPIHQLDACDELNLSPSSLVTVHFSTLEEQDNAVDHFDALSLVVPKIRVVMSDRKDLAETAEEENTLLPQKVSEETGNLMKHAGISGVTADCARQYTAMMNDVCTAKKVLSRPKLFKMDKGYSKPELSNLFDFCDQMKRETDYSFQSNMNSVVRRSCKTKYRFYLLVTSDDPFFEETKLEAEGHTAVQPSEFFLGEDSSTLLIILRNEDIAEHICEVPHLLKLKKSPGVRFAGIDEPDDVVNLTHQEVFTRGGFIMFNRTATESLSLCNMKTMTKILQELNTTGKWKWIWHYRDSRQLKENARLSAEAKEKNLFINWCQEIGLLEVLPYHECDLLSRDQPDYLTCLVHLQVQNISARYPVFITDRSFGTNGIVTLTLSSILTCSPSESFTV
uniref:Uncharacterized protein n=1 Tax=Mola mola TaxID=94237 RepID=A0A3Q4BBI1_MOLML